MGLFGKQEKKPAPSASESAHAVSTASKNAPAVRSLTIIGPHALVKGDLVSTDDVTIEGRVEGKVKCEGMLTIGPSGEVRAEIDAKSVTVRGKIEGNCTASHRVEITDTGKVLGNLRAPLIVVAEGAVFRGASEMIVKEEPKAPPKREATAQPAPHAPAPKPPEAAVSPPTAAKA